MILWLVFVWESVIVIDFLSVSRTFPKTETLYISASVKIPLVTVCPVSFLLRIHSISPRRISSSWRSPLPPFLWFPDGDLCVSRHIVGAAHQMGGLAEERAVRAGCALERHALPFGPLPLVTIEATAAEVLPD